MKARKFKSLKKFEYFSFFTMTKLQSICKIYFCKKKNIYIYIYIGCHFVMAKKINKYCKEVREDTSGQIGQ